jgi:serine/threonine-protein kinase
VAVSLEQFVEQLSGSGLMSAQELSAFQQHLPPQRRPQNAEGLARELVEARRLTRYQAAAVAQGKAQTLVFDEYVILDKLGQGGMGVVLKAEHRRMKRLVAIKVIAPAAVKSPDAVRRFYREVEAAARLSHPNIVAAHDAREYRGSHCLVMEYVEGKDLAVIVKENGPLPVRQAVDCILQAARGLQYAHEQGIIHRDIKPGNLLLDRKGVVKILDMGLARMDQTACEEGAAERLTESGQIMGTGDYMAPEQALDTHRADARSDIYSLGCSLFRLLTGKPPYRGETFTQLFLAHRELPVPSLVALRPDVPAALDAVFQKMIAKLPDQRQQTMAQVIAELEALQGTSNRSGADDEASNSVFAFLREYAAGSATRQRVSTRVEQTLDHSRQPQTGTNFGLAVRTRRRVLIGIGLAAALVLCGAVIALRHPEGTKVSSQYSPPGRVQGGAAPPPATAPFDANKAGAHQAAWAKYLGVPVAMTNSIGMKFVLIPPGEFRMGTDQQLMAKRLSRNPQQTVFQGSGPQHRVRITRPFYLGACEVTQREFRQVTDKNPSAFSADGARRDRVAGQDADLFPVDSVSWTQAVDFCSQLSAAAAEQSARRRYRPTTEAEWEYACRAGSAAAYAFGDDMASLADYAWPWTPETHMPHPVAQKKPNAWGLYDILGNVLEMCSDRYGMSYYTRSPLDDPRDDSTGTYRVLRGGYYGSVWNQWPDPGPDCRGHFNAVQPFLGFRVVCEIPLPATEN